MLLDLAHEMFGWPSREEVLFPSGAGPRVQAELAQRKLGTAIRAMRSDLGVVVGVLFPNAAATDTEVPLAVACEFDRPLTDSQLREVHRLAWNYCRSPLLITLEPHIVRSWSCCEPPAAAADQAPDQAEVVDASFRVSDLSPAEQQLTHALHWLQLASGQFFEDRPKRFQRRYCADHLLLENLKAVRRLLIEAGLDQDTSHDLIARVIFIQFLMDRKDSRGNPALGPQKLASLHREGVLRRAYSTLPAILSDIDDTYRLFAWLDSIFNGDLFSGAASAAENVSAAEERERVTSEHLSILANFVSGTMKLATGQRLFWRSYSFDVIPLEFISSIYEEFVRSRDDAGEGTVYTPPHVVDFVLDRVLPWSSDEWDVKVLDPACGSGIFLVKAYQRLIHRWQRAHGRRPTAKELRSLLENQLFGTDIDPHAVRVASFSLYLAMCDEIDPRHYWTRVRFPKMRGRRLFENDFFSEDVDAVSSTRAAGRYDVVVGNAPWGRNTIGDSDVSELAKEGWTTFYGNAGPLFLPKAAKLCSQTGLVSLMQPAGLLFNDVLPARSFREQMFRVLNVREVVNLSALRFGLFNRRSVRHRSLPFLQGRRILTPSSTFRRSGHKSSMGHSAFQSRQMRSTPFHEQRTWFRA